MNMAFSFCEPSNEIISNLMPRVYRKDKTKRTGVIFLSNGTNWMLKAILVRPKTPSCSIFRGRDENNKSALNFHQVQADLRHRRLSEKLLSFMMFSLLSTLAFQVRESVGVNSFVLTFIFIVKADKWLFIIITCLVWYPGHNKK
jgi:hypothetical protein